LRMLETDASASAVTTPLESAHLSREMIFFWFLDAKIAEVLDADLARNAVDGALGVNASADVAERRARGNESFMVESCL